MRQPVFFAFLRNCLKNLQQMGGYDMIQRSLTELRTAYRRMIIFQSHRPCGLETFEQARYQVDRFLDCSAKLLFPLRSSADLHLPCKP